MPIPVRPTFATADPRWQCRITDDGSPTLVRIDTDDAMHSGCGALAETRHVYLAGSGIGARLADGQSARVLELGFGTGLGWLVTAQAALDQGAPLDYVALESTLPPADVIGHLELNRFIDHPGLVDATLEWFAEAAKAIAAERPAPMLRLDNVTLTVWVGDAAVWCTTPLHHPFQQPDHQFDAIYFDPYSPEASPRLWQTDILAAMRAVTKPSGRLATYCVNRQVRDAMTLAGWVVSKQPGPPGGKREVLVASR